MKIKILMSVIITGLLVVISFCSAQTHDQLMEEAPYKTVPELIGDLYSDNIAWNATAAVYELWRNRTFEDKVMLLQDVLLSSDYQQRHLAAELLRRTEKYTPGETLAEVMVEGLKDDILPHDPGSSSYNFIFTAAGGTRFLIENPEIGTSALEEALSSRDGQQRFLSAYILAVTGRHREAAKIAEILIPHLKDDRVNQNACHATHGLYNLGKKGLPYLKPFASSADKQQGTMVRFIISEIEGPERSEDLNPEPKPVQCISRAVINPARHLLYFKFDGLDEKDYSFYDNR